MLSIGVVPRDDSIPVERRLSVHTELVLYSIHGQTSLWFHFSAALPTEAAAPLRRCASPERTLDECLNTLFSMVLTIGLRELCSGWTISLS